MLEYCVCCQSYAPEWDDPAYLEWCVVLSPEGEYLGVVCAGCHVDDELAFLGTAPPAPRTADELAARRRAARPRRHAGRPSRRAA